MNAPARPIALLVLLLLGGCASAPQPGPEPLPSAAAPPAAPPAAPATAAADPRQARAQEAVGLLKARLLEALQAGLQQGPEQAIAVCRDQAPRLAAEVSTGGVSVGRTSRKLRNPANAPQEWMQPLLDAYEAPGAPAGGTAVALPDGSLGWVEPLRVGPPCLTCHGDLAPGSLRDRLAELYPADQATGYREGDLRGLAWAIVPPAPSGG